MLKTTSVIGLRPDELPWVRLLVSMLRHQDPVVPELARQALVYLSQSASGKDTTAKETKRLNRATP